MAQFLYKAMGSDGAVASGSLAAPSREAAIEILSHRGQMPIALRPDGTDGKTAFTPFRLHIGTNRKPSATELAEFTDELANLLSAELSLARSLQIVIEVSEKPPMRALASRLLESVRSGTSLADAMEQEPVFEQAYSGVVRAGEISGSLKEVMRRLAQHLKAKKEVRERLVSALIYPIILTVMIAATMILIVTFVLPQFEQLFSNAGGDLPLATRLVMTTGTFLRDHFFLMTAIAAGLGLLAWRALRLPAVRRRVDSLLLSDRVLLGLLCKSEIAQFSKTLGMLLVNGIPLPSALSITRSAIRNRALSQEVAEATVRLKEGSSLAALLATSRYFPGYAVRMIRIGEETGRLPAMLDQLAAMLDRDIKALVDRLLTALVPIITIMMGVLIAFFIGSVLIGIMSVNQLAY